MEQQGQSIDEELLEAGLWPSWSSEGGGSFTSTVPLAEQTSDHSPPAALVQAWAKPGSHALSRIVMETIHAQRMRVTRFASIGQL